MFLALRCILAALLVLSASRGVAASEQPNIVFILADDLGINDLACYGRKDQHTPNLDKLAADGMRFTCAYAETVCSPTRAALLTGKAPARLRLTTFLPGRAGAPSQRLLQAPVPAQLGLETPTIARLLAARGYVTACFGKWHLGGAGFGPKEHGFSVSGQVKANTATSASEGGKGEYALTEMAESFLEANQKQPFFLYLAHNSPHVPLAAKPELIAKSKDAFNPTYAAMVETLDDCVGRIMAKLDALQLTERTMLIFASDNGGLHVFELPETPATHNTPYRAGKGFLYEGGLRVPLIVRWPGRVAPGTVCGTPVISTDWTPTWLAAAGLSTSEVFDGVSILPLLKGDALPARSLFWHFPHYSNQGSRPAGAIRQGDWKLIEHYEDGRAELFDLSKDPGEQNELSSQEPARTAALRGQLATWRKSVDAVETRPNLHYDPALANELYKKVDVSRLILGATAAETRKPLLHWRTAMDAAVKSSASVENLRPVILLRAGDAIIHGTTLRYEDSPVKNTLGFWTKPEDWPSWDFEVSTPGSYRVELLAGCGRGCGGAGITVTVGDQSRETSTEETGHFQNFVPRSVGQVTLPQGKCSLAVKARSKTGAAVMDLRQVVLVPAEEGVE